MIHKVPAPPEYRQDLCVCVCVGVGVGVWVCVLKAFLFSCERDSYTDPLKAYFLLCENPREPRNL